MTNEMNKLDTFNTITRECIGQVASYFTHKYVDRRMAINVEVMKVTGSSMDEMIKVGGKIALNPF